jgi:hypothetical protein
MLNYFILGVFIFMLFILDGHKIVYNIVIPRYNRLRRLNILMSSQYKNIYKILWYSFIMICKALYINFIQYVNNTVRMIDHKTYEITYVIGGKMYKMLVTPPRGPSPILQVSNDKSEDVTDLILPYLGPNFDWHGKNFSPNFFGYISLTFEFSDGSEKTFEGLNNVKFD